LRQAPAVPNFSVQQEGVRWPSRQAKVAATIGVFRGWSGRRPSTTTSSAGPTRGAPKPSSPSTGATARFAPSFLSASPGRWRRPRRSPATCPTRSATRRVNVWGGSPSPPSRRSRRRRRPRPSCSCPSVSGSRSHASSRASRSTSSGACDSVRLEAAESARSRVVQGLVRHLLRPVAGRGQKARASLPSGRRILLLHLDGVGRAQLEHAMERGYAPTLRGLVEKGPYRVSSCRAGAPTSTPAFQAGLLYGVQHDIPGYTWFDKRRGREVRMDRSADARALEAELERAGRPLLRGGSVYCSIFSGGARSRRWALSGWKEDLSAEDFGLDEISRAPLLPQARDIAAAAMVRSATAGRIAGASGLAVAPGLVEPARWVRQVGSMQHEPQFLFHRVLTECMFAEFAANSCVIDIARGTPIVYACFIGYDEYAHRRGPFSRMALLKLWELDRMLGRVIAAASALPELGYELYLFSDHGQVATRPAELVLGESLGEHLLADGRRAGGPTG